MAQFNTTTKDNVKALNQKQTVIVETVTTNGKKTRNVYLGNYKRRQDAYYLGMVENGMKTVRKGETLKSYRLLKLSKLLAEVSVKGYNTKTNYLTVDTYTEDTYTVRAAADVPAEAAPEEPVIVPDEEMAPEEEEALVDA